MLVLLWLSFDDFLSILDGFKILISPGNMVTSINAVLFDFKLPDFNLLHLNWQALGVLLVKYCEISFQPIFLISFK